jgi:AbrB family looped-hinge helix DNA binding protein
MLMRVTSKGQVTIPLAMREKAGLMPNTEVEFELDGKAVRIRPARRKTVPSRGERLVAHMRGRGDVRLSTNDIMALTRDE